MSGRKLSKQKEEGKRRWCLALRIIAGLGALGISLYLSLMFCAWAVWGRAGPKMDLRGPAGEEYKAHVELAGFVDTGLYLRAQDWPWTFWRAQTVDGYSPYDEPPREIRWSGDGSVLAVRRAQWVEGPDVTVMRLTRAYDFRKHELLEGLGAEEVDRAIAELMKERGGMGPDVASAVDEPRLEGYRHEGFPWWGWSVPCLMVTTGMWSCVRFLRESRNKNGCRQIRRRQLDHHFSG